MFYRILLICFVVCISINTSFAKDDYPAASEENYSDSNYENAFNYEDSQENNYIERRPLKNPAFPMKKNITLGGLILRVSSIVLLLLGALFSLKVYLTRNNLLPQGNFLEELTQKLTNSFSTFAPSIVKLKQSLILTPGQNVYLVEVEGKKLLLGGTHQGGVQFLADLSDKAILNGSNENIDFKQIKQIEEYQNYFGQNYNNNVTYEIKNDPKPYKHVDLFSGPLPENPYLTASTPSQEDSTNALKTVSVEQPVQKQGLKPPFKRRSNFRQTLLSKAVSNQS